MANLIKSNVPNYQSRIESAFTAFLRDSGASAKTISNYLSDLRSFLFWYTASSEHGQNSPSDDRTFLASVSDATLEDYKASMMLSRTPSATINRRLSSLRTFFTFTSTQGLTPVNPSQSVKNIRMLKETEKATLLEDFTKYLSLQGSSEKTKANYRVDINNFLTWIRESTHLPQHSLQNGNSNDQNLLFQVNAEMIETYIQDQNRANTPIATINRRLSSLRMMYQFLCKERGLTQSPIEAVKNLSADPMTSFTPLVKAFCEEEHDPIVDKNETQTIIEDFIRWRLSPA